MKLSRAIAAAVVLAAITAPAFAQLIPPPSNPYLDGMMRGAELARKRAEIRRMQAETELLRRQAAAASEPTPPLPPTAQGLQVTPDFWMAELKLKAMYPDYDRYAPLCNIIAEALRPDFSKISPAEYLELLYVTAKHASFAAQGRASIGVAPAIDFKAEE